MFHKLVDKVLGIATMSDVEAYYADLQRRTAVGAPTYDEARLDYRSFIRPRTTLTA